MEAVAGIETLRAGRYRHDRVHQRSQHQLVARPARRDLVAERPVWMDGSILEEVKGIGHLPFGDPPRLQRLSEVRPAAPVTFCSVLEPVAPIVTHRGDDVLPADVIPDDLEHRTPPVAFNLVPDL